MINLIKNELIKIFKKKSLYIIIIIILIFSIINTFLTNKSEEAFEDISRRIAELTIEMNKMTELETYNQLREYVFLKNQLDRCKLTIQYEIGSWQYNFIRTSEYIDNLIRNINEYEYDILIQDVEIDNIYEEYQEALAILDSGNWRFFVSKELEETKQELLRLEADAESNGVTRRIESDIIYNKERINVLNWRLEKNISYATSYLNTALERYLVSSRPDTIYGLDTYEYKLETQREKENIAINKYILDSNQDFNANLTTRAMLMQLFQGETFICMVIMIVFITATLITDEYSKGTIKTLLTKPYSRMQVLASKYLSCCIFIIFSVAFMLVIQLLVGGMFYGFESLNIPTALYNFNNGELIIVNVFIYVFIQLLLNLPALILIMTVVFGTSIITKNSAINIIFVLIILFVLETFHSQITEDTISYMKYLITINCDFGQYFMGRISRYQELNQTFSVFIYLIYFLALLIPTFITFKKEDIKNL